MSGGGIVDLQSKEPRPTPPSWVFYCAERAPGWTDEDRLARPKRRPIATQSSYRLMLPA